MAYAKDTLSLIPEPKEIHVNEGHFILSKNTAVYGNNKDFKTDIGFLNDFMSETAGYTFSGKGTKSGFIRLEKLAGGGESYALSVTKKGILIKGGEAGIFYGIQTLEQLVEKAGDSWQVPEVEIKDSPRFNYRGMMLDVSRHFFSVEFVKEFLDQMSRYKLNTFHWHLSDDQGWRIQIKKYPKLTEVGAWRNSTQILRDPNNQDKIPYGGYYTQEEIKDIVKYAAKRHITIIPEIDMPGHMMAAIAAYPNLSCKGGIFSVSSTWGVRDNILCAGNEEVYRFVEDVLTEVMDLFPGKYIHIGGDEAPKTVWKQCPKCQAMIKKEGLKNEDELQSYFTKRIEKFLNGKGRSIIGWDEILAGGIAPNATIMSWRGEQGGIDAANMGHNVIMTPEAYAYFDRYQSRQIQNEPYNFGSYVPLEKVYNYNPLAGISDSNKQKYVIGIQGNIWTEYILSGNMVFYMAYPRALALAENAWSDSTGKDYSAFLLKLPTQLYRLEKEHITFRIPEPIGLKNIKVDSGVAKVDLVPSVKNAKIYYTLDGSVPTVNSTLYEKPFTLAVPFSGVDFKCIERLESGRESVVLEPTD